MSDLIITSILAGILVYLLGASIGSFLMVVVRRGHEGKSWSTGRSVCESCGKGLMWWEMIPSLSYICLGGRCSKCKAKIDPSHFIGETGLGIIFTVVFIRALYGNLTMIEALVHIIALTVVWKNVMSDLLYKEITSIDVWVTAFAISVINHCWVSTAILIALDIALTRNDNLSMLGAGDIDIVILMYAFVGGLYGIINIMLFSSLIALITYFLVIRKGEDKRIPFVPFLFCGLVLTILGIRVI